MAYCGGRSYRDEEKNEERVPTIGVSLKVLETLLALAEENDEVYTRDVRNNIVKPMTKRKECTLVKLIRDGGFGKCGSKDIGKATHFISHAWDSKFKDFVSAVKSTPGLNADRAFIWLDIAVKNQHDEEQDWFGGFKTAIKEIGHTVLVMSPWNKAAALERAWCLWEIFCTVSSGTELTGVVPKSAHESFIESISDEEDFTKIFQSIDVSKATCSYDTDTERIMEAVEDGVGHHEVNVTVSSALRDAIVNTAMALPVFQGRQTKEKLTLKSCFAMILNRIGKLSESIDLYGQVIKGREKLCGEEDNSTLLAVGNQAIVLKKIGNLKAARKGYLRVIRGRENNPSFGRNHIKTVQVVMNLAIVYRKEDNLKAARRMYERALVGYEQHWGKGHVNTMKVIMNIAVVDRREGKLDAALKGYQIVVDTYEKHKPYGRNHRNTLRAVMNKAIVLKKQGNYRAAKQDYERVIRGYEKIYGKNDPNTKNAKNNLRILLEDEASE